MRKYMRERAATEFEVDAGSVAEAGLSQAGAARRSFLGRIGRLSTALAVFGVGAETWMHAVSRRSIMSSAVAAGVPRDRQLHPFPSDDSFNMPLGMGAWYAPTSDECTRSFTSRVITMAVNNGWSHPCYLATTSDPLHKITNRKSGYSIESYLPDENGEQTIYEHLVSDAKPAEPANYPWPDGHMHILINNDVVENFGTRRVDATNLTIWRCVRNRLDHYAHAGGSNPLRNRAGTRAWGGSSIAGLIRKHEVETSNPHIPHALAIAMRSGVQLGTTGQGDTSSPLFSTPYMFPASTIDSGGYAGGTGPMRMGMRFALDPGIATDTWINTNAPNFHQRAVARAMRDYGCIVCDATGGTNVLYCEQGVPGSVETALQNLDWMRSAVRRVAGAGPIHNPTESHWNTWRDNSEGWGGGAPRVPYSPPLSSAIPPQSPGSINVTESMRFGEPV